MTTAQPLAVRDALPGVDPLFSERWSPRTYLDRAVDADQLALLFDAARWSPSCYNEQPWRFITCRPESRHVFLDLLVASNQTWASQAPVIGFIVASRYFQRNEQENLHAAFDTGAAWMAMSLQAHKLGLYAHGMGGIDYDRVYSTFGLDREKFQVICGFTLGYRDPAATETITERLPLAAIWEQH